MDSSKTAENSTPGKPFVKGDARINRKGRPKTFDGLRELAQQIAHEEAQARDKETGALVPVVIAGRKVTTAELVLRRWFQSNDGKLQIHAMEVAFGKVPQTLEVGGPDGGPIQLEIVERIVDADATPGS
jgi:hypothetical protein